MSLRNPELQDARYIKDIDAMPSGDAWILVFATTKIRSLAAFQLGLEDFKDKNRFLDKDTAEAVITGVLATLYGNTEPLVL